MRGWALAGLFALAVLMPQLEGGWAQGVVAGKVMGVYDIHPQMSTAHLIHLRKLTEDEASDSSHTPYVEDQSRDQALQTSGSIAVAVLFMALFNFGFCCCCWCFCRALESLNHPFRQHARRGRHNHPTAAVHQQPSVASPIEMMDIGSQPLQSQVKTSSSVVIVSPGGDVEIGIPEN